MIEAPERFRWVYSHVHPDETARSKNTDALDGMRQLKAVEICDVLDEKYELLERANAVPVDMRESINRNLKERRPIDQTRREIGLTSSARKDAAKADSPIDALWAIVGPAMGGVSRDQFFGFEPNPAMQGVPHTQHGALSGAHILLNLLGLSPDNGLAKREKIRNVLSDGQHVGMASYCDGLLSADKRFCDKANAIYSYIGSRTKALWFPYKQEGCVVQLGITAATT